MSESDKSKGLYEKFTVERRDGRSAPGEKHYGCEYFVLDLTHDRFAAPAIRAYAEACRASYPALASDLVTYVPRQAGSGLDTPEQAPEPDERGRNDAPVLGGLSAGAPPAEHPAIRAVDDIYIDEDIDFDPYIAGKDAAKAQVAALEKKAGT